MSEKRLSLTEQAAFFRHMKDWCIKAKFQAAVEEWAKETTLSARTFRDKISKKPQPGTKRSGQEFELFGKLLKEEIGEEDYQEQFEVFVEKMSDADNRDTILNGDPEAEEEDDEEEDPRLPVPSPRAGYQPTTNVSRDLKKKWNSFN